MFALCNFSVDVTASLAVSIMVVSSAKVIIVRFSIFGIPLLYSRLNQGPRKLPCGTPALTFLSSEDQGVCLLKSLHVFFVICRAAYVLFNPSYQTITKA